MRFPDAVTIMRASGEDEYGNPAADWDAPEEIPAKGFLLGNTILVERSADIRPGDRLRVSGKTFAIEGDPNMLRSPNRNIMWSLDLTRLPDGA